MLDDGAEFQGEEAPVRIAALDNDRKQSALACFSALAGAQRGRPEILATEPRANPGLFHATGIFTWLAEHVGDLSHRMTEALRLLGVRLRTGRGKGPALSQDHAQPVWLPA